MLSKAAVLVTKTRFACKMRPNPTVFFHVLISNSGMRLNVSQFTSVVTFNLPQDCIETKPVHQ